MKALVMLANGVHRVLEAIANASGWLLIVLMAVTCVDVFCRKLAPVYPDVFAYLPFSRFQELEWHLHAAIFSMWLGFNYAINAHPRVDSYVANLTLRKKAWIELVGSLAFAIPYTVVLIFYGWDFWLHSYLTNESSDAAVGLPYRWIIKGVYYAGLWLLLLAILSVALRLIAYLFGWVDADEARLRLGSAVSEV
jgi:TRAP-type mannitol/chloroaromatic compound transport system permease small subunit